MTTRLRRALYPLIACLAAVLLTSCSHGLQAAGAHSGRTLIFALDQAEDHPSYIALENFSERLEQATDGRWDVRVYPNASLGNQQETVQLVGDGSVDMTVASGTLLENLNDDFRTLGLPLIFDSVDDQMEVLSDDSLVGDLFSSLESSNHLTVLGGFTQGERHLYTRSGPIERPKDLAGMKVRVQESDLMINMLGSMGSSPTPLSYAEVYTAVQSGVLDGAENNLISYMTEGHNEVAKHVALTGHQIGTDYIVINSDVLGDMTEQDRRTFEREWQTTVEKHTELWLQRTDEAQDQAEEEGTEFTDVDEHAFRDALRTVLDGELQDPDVKELYERIRDHQQ
ncbi:TRAP transporter substrate-binding protein [Nesterenkonia halophila]|uniref:TRAP transporter substrate-binding protein n=1 Tax=Nesterenkonia halophila TaxID=302044 RepID=UPI0012928003|nr:TRAP transporter substrate-binding protein [Nesterenkonia halophila]